jgi:hypothetical protein
MGSYVLSLLPEHHAPSPCRQNGRHDSAMKQTRLDGFAAGRDLDGPISRQGETLKKWPTLS